MHTDPFDAKTAFRNIKGTYTLREYRVAVKNMRQKNLPNLGADVTAEDLTDLARIRGWVTERDGRFVVRV